MSASLRDAFLEDIIAHPEDNTPRLIFADWLDDQGEADRANFIRLQIEQEGLAPTDPRRQEIEAQCTRLLESHRQQWSGGIDRLAQSVSFRRGFIAQVRLGPQHFLESASQILQMTPIEELDLDFTGEGVAAIIERPELRRVTRLTGTSLGDVHVEQLADSRYIGQPWHIYFHSCGLTALGIRSLVRISLSKLQTLNLGANELGDEGVALLVGHPELGALRDLGLGANSLYAGTAQALVHAPSLGALRKLNLGANYLADDAVTMLANASNLRDLEDLDLRYNEFGGDGGEALLRSPYLQRITHLNLNRNSLNDQILAALRERFGEALEA